MLSARLQSRVKMRNSKPALCPICASRQITFHSETAVPIKNTVERTHIYTCEESHAFIVPCGSSKCGSESEVAKRQESSSLADRMVRERNKLRSNVYQLVQLTTKLIHLQGDVEEARAQLISTRRTTARLVSECRDNLENPHLKMLLATSGDRSKSSVVIH